MGRVSCVWRNTRHHVQHSENLVSLGTIPTRASCWWGVRFQRPNCIHIIYYSMTLCPGQIPFILFILTLTYVHMSLYAQAKKKGIGSPGAAAVNCLMWVVGVGTELWSPARAVTSFNSWDSFPALSALNVYGFICSFLLRKARLSFALSLNTERTHNPFYRHSVVPVCTENHVINSYTLNGRWLRESWQSRKVSALHLVFKSL